MSDNPVAAVEAAVEQAEESTAAAEVAAAAAEAAVEAAAAAETIAQQAAAEEVAEVIAEHQETETWQSDQIASHAAMLAEIREQQSQQALATASLSEALLSMRQLLETMVSLQSTPVVSSETTTEAPKETTGSLASSGDTPAEVKEVQEERKRRFRLL